LLSKKKTLHFSFLLVVYKRTLIPEFSPAVDVICFNFCQSVGVEWFVFFTVEFGYRVHLLSSWMALFRPLRRFVGYYCFVAAVNCQEPSVRFRSHPSYISCLFIYFYQSYCACWLCLWYI
jgi:hypothetical protein